MKDLKLSYLYVFFVILFLLLSYFYYNKSHQVAFENARDNIHEFLVTYKSIRSYVSKFQKEEVYRLQSLGEIDYEYFHPSLLSSTFTARSVNEIYNQTRAEKNKKPIEIKFASNNPRNPINKATSLESDILKKFNNNDDMSEFSKIIKKEGEPYLFYAIPTKRNTAECLRCHSIPASAPKEMVKLYGETNGFNEKVGDMRAVIVTRYPLKEDLEKANSTFLVLSFTTFVIFGLILYLVKRFIHKIKEEKMRIQTILDTNPNIIIVTDGTRMISCNKFFIDFFNYTSLEEFHKDYNCICNFFLTLDDIHFDHENNEVNGKKWVKYLADNNKILHSLKLQKNGDVFYFNINAAYMKDKKEILITLQNITELKIKNELITEQSKNESLEEMIENIAHQWRQPLSVISSGATGMLMQKQFGKLEDEQLEKSCNIINENAQYLSKTIDSFRDFIKGDRELVGFNLKDNINNFLNLIQQSLKRDDIRLISTLDQSIEIKGYPNELIQCYMSIFNNAKDALKTSPYSKKYIFIETCKKGDKAIIKIRDNGDGIPKDILPRIFEPYFTTKHQIQGTGLGLHIAYTLITKGVKGTLWAHNVHFNYEGHLYTGAEFIIELPYNRRLRMKR